MSRIKKVTVTCSYVSDRKLEDKQPMAKDRHRNNYDSNDAKDQTIRDNSCVLSPLTFLTAVQHDFLCFAVI